MFINQTFKFRSILPKLTLNSEALKVNQGAIYIATTRGMATSDLGSGAGKGGGSGGSVREAGGGLGKMGAAQEEMYFSKQNKEMKDKLKQHLKDEIKKHDDAIKASKELLKEIEKEK